MAEGVLQEWLRAQEDADGRPGGQSSRPPPRDLSLPPPPPPTLERAIATALGRAAGRSGLGAVVEKVDAKGLSLAELIETVPDDGLITLLEGPQDALGMIALCPLVIASLIEVEAMGRLGRSDPEPRRPTRTDATIAAVFVNRILDEISSTTAALPAGSCWAGYRYASHLEGPRPLHLMLEDIGFRTASLQLRLGYDGRRTGSVIIALPGAFAPGQEVSRRPGASAYATHASEAGPGEAGSPVLAAIAAEVPITLQAILTRRKITMRELRRLKPGLVLALPAAALSSVRLETGSGQLLASGRLGEEDGFFALKLVDSSAASGNDERLAEARSGFTAADDQEASSFSGDVSMQGPVEPPISDLTQPDAFRMAGETASDHETSSAGDPIGTGAARHEDGHPQGIADRAMPI